MAKYLDYSGLQILLGALKDGTLKVGYAKRASALGIDGIIPVANLPQGALERLVVVNSDIERFTLTTDNIQTGDTVKVVATKKMYFVVDDSKLNTEDGYTEYAAGSAVRAEFADSAGAVNWGNIQGKPNQFPAAPHQHTVSEVLLTGYAKAASYVALAAGDTLAQALGKLEAGLLTK